MRAGDIDPGMTSLSLPQRRGVWITGGAWRSSQREPYARNARPDCPSAPTTPALTADAVIEPILIGAYALTNSLRIVGYLPQIVAVMRASDRAEAVSLATWTFWTVANMTTTAYSAVILEDFLTMAVFSGNSVCCAVVVSIVAWKRRRYAGTHAARTAER